jgi:hypothetical protein
MMIGNTPIPRLLQAIQCKHETNIQPSAQIGGIAVGLSISGAVFVNSAKNALISLLPHVPVAQIQEIISGTSSALFESLDDGERDLVLDAIVKALQKVFIVAYVGAAVCVVGSALLRVCLSPFYSSQFSSRSGISFAALRYSTREHVFSLLVLLEHKAKLGSDRVGQEENYLVFLLQLQ